MKFEGFYDINCTLVILTKLIELYILIESPCFTATLFTKVDYEILIFVNEMADIAPPKVAVLSINYVLYTFNDESPTK